MALLLGFDIGTSSIKASLLEVDSGREVANASSPKVEMPINSPRQGFAEQDPLVWWENVKIATRELARKSGKDLREVKGIGITYQMHGLVIVDRDANPIRPSIIWCDSRAVPCGERAYSALGDDYCRTRILNSPGNFTAAKLRWVMEHEAASLSKAVNFMLPGDYIALKLTGRAATTSSGLSEMILWDFASGSVAAPALAAFEIPRELVPEVVPIFGEQGRITAEAARDLGLAAGTPVTYRAGDQPNNAFSLNVLEPGDIAATAGTSGVVYGVGDTARCDSSFRVNTFLHVTHKPGTPRLGVLLCLNGVGILNAWLKKNVLDANVSYEQMNALAASAPLGSAGLSILPYGNGAERTLNNRDIGASIHGLRLNIHDRAHLLRAAQEGIVFALYYGLEIMQGLEVKASRIRAGNANMFLSPLFCETFASVTGAQVEILDTDGAQGAARAAGVGAGVWSNFSEAFAGLRVVRRIEPDTVRRSEYRQAYDNWRLQLTKIL